MHNNELRIKELRKSDRGCGRQTQEQFAKTFNVSLDTVRNWEQGRTIPRIDQLCALSDYYGCSIDYILGRIECETVDRQRIQDLTHLSNGAIKAIEEIPFYDEETGKIEEPYYGCDPEDHQAANWRQSRIDALNMLLESRFLADLLDNLYSCKNPKLTESEDFSRREKMQKLFLEQLSPELYEKQLELENERSKLSLNKLLEFFDGNEWVDENDNPVKNPLAKLIKSLHENQADKLKEERKQRDNLCRYNVQFVASKIADDLLREGAEERGEHSAQI